MMKPKFTSAETVQIYNQLENLSMCCPSVSMFISQSQHVLTPYLMLCDISIIEKQQVIEHFTNLIKEMAAPAADEHEHLLDAIKESLIATAQNINDEYEEDAKKGGQTICGGTNVVNACMGCQHIAFLTKQIVEIRKFLKMDEGNIKRERLDQEADELIAEMEMAQKEGFSLTDSQKELLAEMKKRREEHEKEKLKMN